MGIGLIVIIAIISMPSFQNFQLNSEQEYKALVIARGSGSVGLDPANVTDAGSFEVTRNIYDTLVEYERDGTTVKPALANSWRVSENGLQWTFYLRRGVFFHDGTEFDADAVVFNFERWMDPDNPYHHGRFYYWGYKFGGYPGVIEQVEALDKYTVRFTLTKPMAPFISNLAMPSFAIASPEAIKAAPGNLELNPVGTGPFIFEEREEGKIVLLANSNYWEGAPNVNRVTFLTVSDREERFEMLNRGEAHIIDGLSPGIAGKMNSGDSFRMILRPSMNVGYLAIHNEKDILEKTLVRKAISYGINKERIVEQGFGGFAKSAESVVPPSLWGNNHNLEDHGYDVAKAKALLAEAGYPYGFKTELWVPPVPRPYLPYPDIVANLIKEDLEEIGIELELVSYDWPTYIEKLQHGEHQLALLGWIGDNGDPDNFLYVLLDKDNATVGTAGNISFYKNDQVHDLLIEAQQESSQFRRTQFYHEAQRIIHEDVPMVPLVHTTPPLGVSNKVRNYIPHPTGIDKLAQVDLVN